MKHIVLYVNSMQTSGGIERVIATLAEIFKKDYKVSILVKDNTKSFYSLPKEVKMLTLNYQLNLDMNKTRLKRAFVLLAHLHGAQKRLKKKMESIEYDYLYVTTPVACLEYYLANLPKEKLIISEHSSRSNFNLFYRTIKKLLYHKYPVQIVPTQVDFDWYRNRQFPSVKIPHFRSALNYIKSSQSSNIVLNIGRMTDDKQQLALLQMWGKIIFEHGFRNWKLRIVGDGENYKSIVDFIANNQLNEYVEICSPTEKVELYYNDCSIYASSSQREGFPMVLVEAISFGLPTIAFDCPTGPSEILNDGVGVLVELNDYNTYINKLVELMKDEKLRLKYSDTAFERSIHWGEENIMKQWKDVLK